jgi:hypothetical protein
MDEGTEVWWRSEGVGRIATTGNVSPMKTVFVVILTLLLATACETSSRTSATDVRAHPSSSGPNWEEIDKTVQRVNDRKQTKGRLVETERTTEAGFFPMTEEEYAEALETARAEVRKEKPKLAESEVETEAVKRADQAKTRQEQAFTQRASSRFEYKSTDSNAQPAAKSTP